MAELLTIKEIQNELQYKDRRSIIRWCQYNNVQIISYVGTYKKFVIKEEFEREKYQSCHKHSKNNNSTMCVPSKKSKKMMDYRPQGEYEKEFLSIFTNTIATL